VIYSKLSTETLKDFHAAIQKCLAEDDATPQGQMKPYGVREYPDWKEQLDNIEAELSRRSESYTPISINQPSQQTKPTPVEFVLYERIKACLQYEDNLPSGAEKPYGVRSYGDWKEQAEQLEQVLDRIGIPYTKIQW
jgi:hypothetical protein